MWGPTSRERKDFSSNDVLKRKSGSSEVTESTGNESRRIVHSRKRKKKTWLLKNRQKSAGRENLKINKLFPHRS